MKSSIIHFSVPFLGFTALSALVTHRETWGWFMTAWTYFLVVGFIVWLHRKKDDHKIRLHTL